MKNGREEIYGAVDVVITTVNWQYALVHINDNTMFLKTPKNSYSTQRNYSSY